MGVPTLKGGLQLRGLMVVAEYSLARRKARMLPGSTHLGFVPTLKRGLGQHRPEGHLASLAHLCLSTVLAEPRL